VTRTIDPEGRHIAALRKLADFRGARVLEIGCGDGRLTAGFASEAVAVLATDPAAEAVAAAERSVAAELRERVTFRAAAAAEVDVPPSSFNLVCLQVLPTAGRTSIGL
jgi:2-polyprenyl-3-methyl-5-hydroxy-6-metoxy-1,4-benzoquinol methylase